jgi:hypothetical protein
MAATTAAATGSTPAASTWVHGSFGDTFLVNTGNTSGCAIRAEGGGPVNDGGYVIVWRDDNQDGSSAAVMGQRYDSAGNAVGGQFRVNEYTARAASTSPT